MQESVSRTKLVLATVGGVLGVAVLGIGISWVVQGSEWFMYDVFAPRYESTRRATFEESKAYNQGMIQELQNMQFEYVKADESHKKALADIILHRAADYDLQKLPPDLEKFILQLEKERTEGK